MFRTQSLVVVFALAVSMAASSALLPFVSLDEMAPDHACHFLCYMCLEGGKEEDLLACANKLCGRIKPDATCGPVLDLDMLMLGLNCREGGLVMQYLGAAAAAGQKKH